MLNTNKKKELQSIILKQSKKMGLDNAKVARLANIHRSTFGRFMSNESEITLKNLLKVLDVVQVEIGVKKTY